MIDWLSGYTAEYYMTIVDAATWRDTERIEIVSGNISRDTNGLRESATLTITEKPEDLENIVRIYLDAYQNGSAVHCPVFTGYLSTPQVSYHGIVTAYGAECYSVLKALDDVILERGWYADKNRRVSDIIATLTAPLAGPVDIAQADTRLKDYIVSEDGISMLTMLDRVLNASGWRLTINGSGEVTIGPDASEPEFIFDSVDTDCIEPDIQKENDLYSAPNVMMIAADGVTAIAMDMDEDSDISVPGRGREIWKCETNATVPTTESIEQYATRRLKEAQNVASQFTYSRRYIPDIVPGDIVEMNYPAQDMVGKYTIITQDIELSKSARTSEVITEWRQ